MGEANHCRRCLSRIAGIAVFAGLVGACASEPQTGAPVILKNGAPGMSDGTAPLPAPARRADRRIVVRPGQSVGRLALQYQVPKQAIIAANHLQPPYKIEIGQHLLIPGGAGPASAPALAAAGPSAATGSLPPRTIVAVPSPAPAGPPAAPTMAAAPPPAAPPPGNPAAAVIPLDGPPPPKAVAAAVPASPPPPPPPPRPAPVMAAPPPPAPRPEAVAAAAPRRPAEPSAGEEARAEAAAASDAPLPHGGRLQWPVRGRVLAGYGVGAGGAHNDGINIAAPRGAPVRAVEGGVVAYAGNELRSYGNLVLIKHPDGLITAYAHCDELLVKPGEKVKKGQVIAKVGATGGVSEPQLHFELRRGPRPVDPREFLNPAPSAASAGRASAG